MTVRSILLVFVVLVAAGCTRGLLAPQWGLQDGQLAPCNGLRGCVSSQAQDPEHLVAPLVYVTDRNDARNDLLTVVRAMRDSQVVSLFPGYLRVEFSSREPAGAEQTYDIAEFYFPPDSDLIQVRSTPRRNMPDSGENRTRIELIRERFIEQQQERDEAPQ